MAVVGGGIAGTATAAALATAGLAPLLVERHAELAAEASGNPCGLLKPRLTADGGLHGRFYGQAYLHACRRLDALAAVTPDVWAGRGLLAVARDADERATMQRLHATLSVGEAVPVDAVRAQQLAGLAVPHGGLWYPGGGSLRPGLVCRALAAGVPRLRAEVASLVAGAGGGWTLHDAGGAAIAVVDAVVLCNGALLPRLAPAACLPLHANRGQVTLMPALSDLPRHTLTYGGYVTPPVTVDGRSCQVVGATYGRLGLVGSEIPGSGGWAAARLEDDAANLDLLATHLPALGEAWRGVAPLGSRVALRATVADYMPLMGPLFCVEALGAAYGDLHHGRRPDSYPPAPWTPGLFMLGGLGSRGFQTAPLLAEALAALMTGGAPPLADDLLAAVHPARHAVRALRRRPGGAPGSGRRPAGRP